MNPILVHSQPEVLGQCGGVALQHVKYGGPVHRPLANERHVRLVAVLFRQLRVVAVFAGNVLRTNSLPHVLWYVPLNDGSGRR